jgi:hypothetical protein
VTRQDEFRGVFGRLKTVLAVYAPEMVVKHDDADAYYLDTRHLMKNSQPLFFGSVEIRKSYVSFHLMPVYVFPDLLDGIGDLKKRMQGKSCFNFRQIDEAQMDALSQLTRAGYERYRNEGMLGEGIEA